MNFNPSRGPCQGGPIFPFLFILAIEGLGRYLKATRHGVYINNLFLYSNDLHITHQQFVDDIILISLPTVNESMTLKYIFNDFMEASGTLINGENVIFISLIPMRLSKDTLVTQNQHSPILILRSTSYGDLLTFGMLTWNFTKDT